MRWPLFALLLLCGCGPEAALWLRVEAPLLVPDQCDALTVSATAQGRTLLEKTYPLASNKPFPNTVMLFTNSAKDVDVDLSVQVRALKAGALAAPWAQATQTVALSAHQTTGLTLSLCDCSRP